MAKHTALEHPTLGPLTDDLLTPDVRVYQRAKGHRFSSDDVCTAYWAHRVVASPETHLDLGSGLGSVLLLLAWKVPTVQSVGIEAQVASHELLVSNIERNGLRGRVEPIFGDIRDASLLPGRRFELVTGTPPYFPPGTAVFADDEQRSFARIEERGGVEAYLEAASRFLAPGGTFVLCGDARADVRVRAAAPAVGLAVTHHCEVIPRASKPPLFSVWVLREASAENSEPTFTTMTLRDEAGGTTRDADAMRTFSGFPSLFD